MNILGPLLSIAIGIFCIGGARKDWDWFMNNRRAHLVVFLIGRKGARWFYAALGLGFIGIGCAMFWESLGR